MGRAATASRTRSHALDPRRRFDVIVVGAGPAGSHAAALLARKGMRVALLDRAAFPRDKTCGGGLSQKTLGVLGRLPDAVIQREFSGAWITWSNEAAVVKDLRGPAACTVLRSEFDAWLLALARAAGAAFFASTPVTDVSVEQGVAMVHTPGGTFEAPLLLAADGVASVVRKQLFGRDAVHYAPAIEALIPASPAEIERIGARVVFDLGGMPRGYGWVFPKRDHLNVGVYSPFAGAGIRLHLDDFLRRHGLQRARAPRTCGYAIPVRNRLRAYEQGPVLLLGDAAGLADAVWGEGIYFALRSAQLAARAIDEAGGAPRAGRYSALLDDEVEGELRWSRRLATLLYGSGRYAFDALARNRVASEWFAGVITGEVSYRDCFLRTVLGAPRWLLARRHAVEPPLNFSL